MKNSVLLKKFSLVMPSIIMGTIILMGFSSCSKQLSEQELKIVNDDIPKKLYQDAVMAKASALDDYLWESVEEYSEQKRIELQRDIDERNATSNLFGGGWDIAVLFGTTTNELIAKRYDEFVNYINRHRSDMSEIITGMAEVIAKKPSLINQFYNGDTIVSLAAFSNIQKIPATISASSFAAVERLALDDMDKVNWGMAIMGKYTKPSLSVPSLVYAVYTALANCESPKPVYAVYDDENETWDIGYSNKEALTVTFKNKGDIVLYEYISTKYLPAYLKSENNVLNRK